MGSSIIFAVLMFLFASGVVLVLVQFSGGDGGPGEDRLRAVARANAPNFAARVLASQVGATVTRTSAILMPSNKQDLDSIRAALQRAGFYGPRSLEVFLGTKAVAALLPIAIVVIVKLMGGLEFRPALVVGAAAALGGLLGPGYYLKQRTKKRQQKLSQGLPDALDLLVVCVEAGLTLEASFRRVLDGLSSAHPELGVELLLVQHDNEIGRSSGEALKRFAQRTDLDEVRILANVVVQSERYGASISTALKTHALDLRARRRQKAEERAHKAGTLMLFPTVLFIFPSVFIVILGPAAITVMRTMKGL